MRNENLDYQQAFEDIIRQNKLRGITPSLLLHSCCAPCSTYVLQKLMDSFDVTVIFYNPNIMPQEEFIKRQQEQLRLIKQMGIRHIEVDYRHQSFLDAVKGYENEAEGGSRCEICFKLRLETTARAARAGEFNYFGTTLTVSPHKDAELINKIGKQLAIKYNLIFLPSDFKKNGGYKKSIEIAKEYNLYRQDYCGCKF